MRNVLAVGLLFCFACSSSAAPVSDGHDASDATEVGPSGPDATSSEGGGGPSGADAGLLARVDSGSGSADAGPEAEAGEAMADVVANVPDAFTGEDSSASRTGDAAAESSGPHTYDGTSGKPCMSNADCGSINVCTNSYSGNLSTLNGVTSPQFWPTPLCMVPLPTVAGVGNCNPGPDGVTAFCDTADPFDPTSPGICLPLTLPQQAGPTNGFCLPHCTFAPDGSAAMGCPGKDTCVPLGFYFDPQTNAVLGHGYCQGTCQVDADCSTLGAGWVCQADDGYCTKTKKTRTKLLGATCTNSGSGAIPVATSDSETGACNCPLSGTATTSFYCTSTCVVGGVACPNGWVCDAILPGGPLVFQGLGDGGTDLTFPALPKQNAGLAGLCFAPCGRADAAASQCPGAASVPPLSTCSPNDANGTAAGPDCLP